MRTLGRLGLAAAAVSFAVTGCGGEDSVVGSSPAKSASVSPSPSEGSGVEAAAPNGGELPKQPGQQVVPDHCGVRPVTYDGRLWEVKRAPFDMSSAPDTFSGFGEFRIEGDMLRFMDREGTTLTFTLDDGVPPACM